MADICFIVEGTYPYVTGGVSSFIHDYIKSTPNFTYSIIHIGADINTTKELKYTIPPNVQSLDEIYLFGKEYFFKDKVQNNSKVKQLNLSLFEEFYLYANNQTRVEAFSKIFSLLRELQFEKHDLVQLMCSKNYWDTLISIYNTKSSTVSFIDYFYTARYTLLPVLELLSAKIPFANIYHATSTGYAGFLGVIAKLIHHKPLILTEHGIYSNERDIEIEESELLYNNLNTGDFVNDHSFFKFWWSNHFDFLSRLTYHYADEITTIYSGNKCKQIINGALENKITVIPNGIDINKFAVKTNISTQNTKEKILNIALIGRVVAIKDIKTFIKSIEILARTKDNFHAYIIGPYDEDIEYFDECKLAIEEKDLKNLITFTGKVDVKEYYNFVDILVLTSISEGLPLVVLEAFSNKIPCILTNVGACSELIYGMNDEDKYIGQAGIITKTQNAQDIANAILSLIENTELLNEYGVNGYNRASTFYKFSDTIFEYEKIYNKYLHEG